MFRPPRPHWHLALPSAALACGLLTPAVDAGDGGPARQPRVATGRLRAALLEELGGLDRAGGNPAAAVSPLDDALLFAAPVEPSETTRPNMRYDDEVPVLGATPVETPAAETPEPDPVPEFAAADGAAPEPRVETSGRAYLVLSGWEPLDEPAAESPTVPDGSDAGTTGRGIVRLDLPGDRPEPTDTATGFGAYCPVAVRDDRTLTPADPTVWVEHGGKTWYFSGPEARTRFAEDSDRYVPAAGGRDVVLAAVGADVLGEARYAALFRGRVYLFASAVNTRAFTASPAEFADRLAGPGWHPDPPDVTAP